MKNRLLAFFFAICILMSINPITLANAASMQGTDYTSGTLAERLDTIINRGISSDVKPSFPAVTGTFPKGRMFTVKFPTRSWSGYQCIAYTYAAYNYLFDADPYGADATCFNTLERKRSLGYQDLVNLNVRFGAYLRTTCNSNGSFHPSKGHSILILSYNPSNITYLEANTSGKEYRVNLISCSWDNFNRNLLSGKSRYVNTLRQPADSVYNSLTDDKSPNSEGHMEYRYVGYVTSDGRHDCWCGTYLKNKFGSANLQYSDWSTTRYNANGSRWTCGSSCKGNHTGIANYGNNGLPYWTEYTLSDGKNYYWEETRWVENSVENPPSSPTYVVTLDDGSVCQNIIVTNSDTYRGLTTPSREGYTFEGWYTSRTDGSRITSDSVVNLTGDQTLYAHWSKKDVKCPWGLWSEWTTTPVYESETRQVETRKVSEQIKISDGNTEYRYVGYVTNDGRHECWCETYLRSKFGSANLRYSDWSTTQYRANGSSWTCGVCNGNHTGISHYTNDGRPCWAEYTLPDGKNYYWEESRTTEAQYETREVIEYRYRDRICD